MVIQSRALVDARDGLKPSARQIFYSMLLHKLTHNNPYKKTANAVGMAMADFYIHGDSSCEGIIMRAGQNFAMRYPLVDVKGNSGSLIESGNWAAMRYTESRLSPLSNVLFTDIDKDTVTEWRDSYDNTKQYPAVLPSKGFYNLCNGTSGIAVGLASSVPQFNLNELNNALINLIQNPDCDFDDIYCAPDFATGAILLNADEVKESLRTGNGPACKLRSVVEFDGGERCFVVKEIPYSVYTNTICKQLEEIIESEENPGVERFNDLTGATPLIKIYLTKKANPDKVLKYLYKNTSLQYYYGINLTMLDGGKYPKVFTWREALQAHIDHEKVVYRRGFEHDLNKMKFRVHIIDGLLICIARIEEVIQTIKTSSSTSEASARLQSEYILDADQAKAVLDLKLSRLAHLEVTKLNGEKNDLLEKIGVIEQILNNPQLFNAELIKGWKMVAQKFGDARRTKILDLKENGEETLEEKMLLLNTTSLGNIYVTEGSTLYTQKRGARGQKFKLDKGEYLTGARACKNTSKLLVFKRNGEFYPLKCADLNIGEKNFVGEDIVQILGFESEKSYITIVTEKGYIKKSLATEYSGRGGKAITLGTGDKLLNVFWADDTDDIGAISPGGYFIRVRNSDVSVTGRISKGVHLTKEDCICARPIPGNTIELCAVDKNGNIKRTSFKDFSYSARGARGTKLQEDAICFVPICPTDEEIILTSTASQVCLQVRELPLLGRAAQGSRGIMLKEKEKIIGISKI
jgi:DNA gyrase subunit A